MPTFAETPSAQVWWRAVRVVFAVALVGFVVVALWDRPDEAGGIPATITLYGPSFVQDVLDQDVLPAFAASWRESTGERVEFVTSYAGSGLIVDRVLRRFPAEVVLLSSEIDADRLVAGAVLPGAIWRSLPSNGVPFRTPMALLVREGNPLGIRSFDDLARPDVSVVLPDPITSGCGEWAVLAIWGDAVRSGRSEAEAAARVQAVRQRIVAMPPSARAARMLFDHGVGDVAALYEVEARASESGEIVLPERTVLAEPVVCVVPREVRAEARERVDALARFLVGDEARTVWASRGFRPTSGDSGVPAGAFTLGDLGSARDLRRNVVEAFWAPSPREDAR